MKWFLQLLLISFLLQPLSSSAQYEKGSSRIFLELAGSGGLGSFNYERCLNKSENFKFLGRAGFSVAPIDWRNNGIALVFPLMFHGVLGKKGVRPDAGIGQAFTITTKGKYFARMPLCLGVRFQKPGSSFWMRVAYTPIVSYIYDAQLEHWAGLSLGFHLSEK